VKSTVNAITAANTARTTATAASFT
jgi:hypothetical protein